MRYLITLACLICIAAAACAQNSAPGIEPQITGLSAIPTNTDQCRPVQLTFRVVNRTGRTIYSQRPYPGSTYSLYQTFNGKGLQALSGRYMVGVSLNGGADGYPYRWGFQGALQPNRAATVSGNLSLVEVGTYGITATLLKGGVPVNPDNVEKFTVTVDICNPTVSSEPVPARPLYSQYNGRRSETPVTPYVVDGYLLIPVRSFVSDIHAYVNYSNGTIVIRAPGTELILFPGSTRAILNGVPVRLPVQTYMRGTVAYVPIRFIGPFFGTTVYWSPTLRTLYFEGPD